jgi:hypothetical protein
MGKMSTNNRSSSTQKWEITYWSAELVESSLLDRCSTLFSTNYGIIKVKMN